MSDPITKAARSKAKDARQEPAPDAKPKNISKKAKPWRVDYRVDVENRKSLLTFLLSRDWSKFGAYRTKEEAETAIKNDKRKSNYFEYRMVEPE